MQSASQELQKAFNELVSSPSQRGLLAGIEKESLVPTSTISSRTPDFLSDLSALSELLTDTQPAYVILRRYADAADGFVAVTYVPDAAPVRQKMLFAATRLTLVRELGTERFRETLFATTKAELTREGWEKHDAHSALKPPMTEEEESLQNVKEAEAEASRGTTSRTSHVSSGVGFPIAEAAAEALKALESGEDNLVQLKINVSTETIEHASSDRATASTLSTTISPTEPRYSFFRYSHSFDGQDQAPIIFIYTCPTGSKIKERMLYATSRAAMVDNAAAIAGLNIAKKLEASNPDEITEATIHEEFHPKQEQKLAFSRPKRPGRR
ncbi:MAG: hypothetical protein M1819_006641 [Sarea resinae]|nr:MAG: hypothetical protein M1819_006641 [Sarea resinae]